MIKMNTVNKIINDLIKKCIYIIIISKINIVRKKYSIH